MSNNNAERRLMKDLQKLSKETDESIQASPEDNMFNWIAYICGPDDTDWEGGTFKLKM